MSAHQRIFGEPVWIASEFVNDSPGATRSSRRRSQDRRQTVSEAPEPAEAVEAAEAVAETVTKVAAKFGTEAVAEAAKAAMESAEAAMESAKAAMESAKAAAVPAAAIDMGRTPPPSRRRSLGQAL